MRLADFDFDLPRERIADKPSEPRDAARLLVVPTAGAFEDRRIADLPALLRPGDLLVCNDTKVIPARLGGSRGAATVEITLAHDLGGGSWQVFAKGARRLHPGDRIVVAADFAAEVMAKEPDGLVTLRFDLEGAAFAAAL
jgi:S-adenosylmethionine:tRNA ribosyltransferase-isomerase